MKLSEIHNSPDNPVIWNEVPGPRGRLTTEDTKIVVVFGIFANKGHVRLCREIITTGDTREPLPMNWTLG